MKERWEDDDYRQQQVESHSGKTLSDKHKQKIRDAQKGEPRPYVEGENNGNYDPSIHVEFECPFCGETATERERYLERVDTPTCRDEDCRREAISLAMEGRDVPWLEGDGTFLKTDGYREKMSAALEGNSHGGRNIQTVPETGHVVDSNWEAQIDRLFHKLGIDYEYEPETFVFSDGRGYTPDFIVNDTVIEVKGYARERDRGRAEQFLAEYPQYTYVVVGDESVPADAHIAWNDHATVTELLA